ncbi:hypothetical protein L6164_012984 [Bauhinia variegata]|uniref:Uncharacterized protein n=1 Tax=Bauhinia variegata TaxID=167791 RepID=A0ACB9PBR6_BAUVA|nr:hypothetical protein L6164_012984 [Bauhinia variegata]
MSNILAPFQLLELNVISAQDLARVSRSMRTYAVAWVHPDRKLSTRVDTHGINNPTWNDKFVFRVDDEFLYSYTSAIMIDIYALHWFRDIHVGTVRVPVSNLIPPPSKPFTNTHAPLGMRFLALQVKKASGRPQGILNIGVTLLDSSMRSMPLYTHNPSAVGYHHLMGEKDGYDNHNNILSPNRASKPELRRTKSDTSSMIGSRVTAQQYHVKGKNGKASSVVAPSEASSKNRSRGWSKARSLVSGSDVSENKNGKSGSVLGESLISWKGKKGKTSSMLSGSDIVKDSWNKDKIVKPSPVVNRSEGKGHGNPDKINHPIMAESSISSSEMATTTTGDTEEKLGQFPINNNAFEVKPSPMMQNRNSPGQLFRNSPAQQFRNSPKLNLAQGLAGSHRGTPRTTPFHPNTPLPMHPKHLERFNPSFDYETPRRSKLGAPPVLTESELGPSPSEVATAMAKVPKIDEGENSTVGGWSLDESVEGLQSKLERWRTEVPPVYDMSDPSTLQTSSKTAHKRRHTNGSDGLFSCFGNICGVECTIVCGGGNEKKKGGRRRSRSAENLSYI